MTRRPHSGRLKLWRLSLLLCVWACLTSPKPVQAHDFPGEVLVHIWAKPVGADLLLAVRVPMLLLGGVDWPTQGPGYLDLKGDLPFPAAVQRVLAQFVVSGSAGARAPTVEGSRLALPSDRAFASADGAAGAIVHSPLPLTTSLFHNQGYFDVLLRFKALPLAEAKLAVPTAFGLGEKVETIVKVEKGGNTRVLRLVGHSANTALDPGALKAFVYFVRFGFEHVLSGLDHVLFLLCIALVQPRLKRLVLYVTAFTVAHSATLISSALGLVPETHWFMPLVESLIAVSILWLAVENLFVRAPRHRLLVILGFGLVHGFGFSFALRESLDVAGDHQVGALFAFNVGVELGQICIVLIATALVLGLSRSAKWSRRLLWLCSALIAHHAWHWSLERSDPLIALLGAEQSWVSSPPLLGIAIGLTTLSVAFLVFHFRRKSVPNRGAASTGIAHARRDAVNGHDEGFP